MRISTFFVCGMLLLFLGLCAGLTLPFEILLFLAVGWLIFLYQDLPVIHFDWSAIAGAIVLAALFTVGLHSLLTWVWRERKRPDLPAIEETPCTLPGKWSWRWTRSIVAIILLAFMAGISMVGITHQIVWLATAKQPLTKWAMQDFSERQRTHLRLLMLGNSLVNPLVMKGNELPPGVSVDGNGRVLHGWQTLILPFAEQLALSERIAFDQPWYTPSNRAALATAVELFAGSAEYYGSAPADGMAPSIYSGNSRLLGGTRRWKFNEIGDGQSNTILVGEVTGNLPAWGRPGNWRDPADGLAGQDNTFGSPSRKAVYFLFVDGSARAINREIDPKLLGAMATPDSGDRANFDNP